jgi:hypothetical protein
MKTDSNFKMSKQTKIYLSFNKHKNSILKDMFIKAEISEEKAKKTRMKEREKIGQGDEQ